ncbi:MAG TPA: NAD(P)H-dependent oxidoreductase [Streptosporangiaceae bacterium]
MSEPVRILLVSGSTRSGSANTAALRTILSMTGQSPAGAPPAVRAVLYDGLSLLPAFNPDDDHEPLPSEVAKLRQRIAAADAVLFCTPEYAGGLPGSFKNLLDWTVGGGEMYGKPAAWINVAPEGRGDAAQASLTSVLGYVGATLIAPACRRIQVDRAAIAAGGLAAAPAFRPAATEVLQAILAHLGKA